ncbi:hypothetical protein WG922_01910 [Ramlibacter sp. AN1015]|uniref:hypothetical protein n=1 Tax=Ramlibacter sp. AN1015 TaxID=3133428 RepID=UPI0030C505D8
MKDDVETRISPDGLRYVSKTQGTAFPTALGYTISCFVCGRHRPRTQMASFLLAGGRQWRCKGSC